MSVTLFIMRNWILCSCIFFTMATCDVVEVDDSDNSSISSKVWLNEDFSKVLSRRKRFLVFPEGSSFQLVFCVQTAALIPIGDIFLYSSTAALAWNLPTDPKFLYMLKENGNFAQRRGDAKHVYYVNEKGNVLAKVPYRRRLIVNPAFAKRSVDGQQESFKHKLKMKIDRTKMHERQKNREYLNREHMDENSIEYHRSSRVGLYEKLETLFTALGHNGRNCVLYKLCQSAQETSKQGTFLQEVLRIVFTLPKGKEFEKHSHKDYDEAHVINDNCATLYPGCEDINIIKTEI